MYYYRISNHPAEHENRKKPPARVGTIKGLFRIFFFVFGVVAVTYAQDLRPSAGDYVVSFVKSERKWKYGFRSEPYDKLSEYFQDQVTDLLAKRSVRRVPVLISPCCAIYLELLEVSTHPAAIKKPGIDASANLVVRDRDGKLLYAKGYRGESRTAMSTWGRMIDRALDDMAKNVIKDEDLLKLLVLGRL